MADLFIGPKAHYVSDGAPPLMSLEGRAKLIADVAGRLHAKPEDRRKAVEAEALAHLRVVAAKATGGDHL